METYTAVRREHRGYIIETRTHHSGCKTYNVYEKDGETVLQWACGSLTTATLAVDMEIEWKKWMAQWAKGEASV